MQQMTGRTPIIYTYRYFWQTAMANTSAFSGYPLWIAQYSGTAPAYPLVGGWDTHRFWQYTSTGSIPGITGGVDISDFNGDLASLDAMADGTVSAIQSHWISLGGAASYLGATTSAEYDVPGGRAQNFAGGTIYWSYGTGAWAVRGTVADRYRALGGPASFLGLPTNDEIAVPGGRMSAFTGGQLYWSPATGAREMHGALLGHYLALGGASAGLGLPSSDETDVPGRPGARQNELTGATLLWSPATGAQEVHGSIRDRYLALGGPGGFLGLPTSDEYGVAGGRASSFSAGTIYWSAATQAHEMYGALLGHYLALGGPGAGLGLPTSGEIDVPGVAGARRNELSGGATLYWSPGTGAQVVRGSIRVHYLALGGPTGLLGLPSSDEYDVPGGRASNFVGGITYWSLGTDAHEMHGALLGHYLALGSAASGLGLPTSDERDVPGVPGARGNDLSAALMLWSPATDAHEVHGSILGRYASLGGATSALGLPTTDEYAVPGGRRNDFSRGSIGWVAATGATSVRMF
ncbi:MAG: hypothetical protein NVSMB13_15340 [Mycobacteriales bacterium]